MRTAVIELVQSLCYSGIGFMAGFLTALNMRRKRSTK